MSNLATAVGAAQLINSNISILNAVGLTKEEYELVIQDTQWTAAQRREVTFALKTLSLATAENIGLPPVTLPTEFIAGVIVTTVNPVNYMIASYWMAMDSAQGAPAANLADRYQDQFEKSTTTELISLIFMLTGKLKNQVLNENFLKYVKGVK